MSALRLAKSTARCAFITASFVAGVIVGELGKRSEAERFARALDEWLATGLDGWSGDDND